MKQTQCRWYVRSPLYTPQHCAVRAMCLSATFALCNTRYLFIKQNKSHEGACMLRNIYGVGFNGEQK